jgi:hypothetical protein
MKMLNASIYNRLHGATALTSLLAGGTAGTSIFSLRAVQGAAYPYIVYNVQGGGDENLTQNRTKNLVVFVRAYSASSNAEAGSVDAQLDIALHMVPFTDVSGWANIWLARETDLETVEDTPGGQVFMNGAFYRVILDKS